MSLTNIGLKRLKAGTADAYFRRARQISRMIKHGEYRGAKLIKAKKRYDFCMWKARSLSGMIQQKRNKNVPKKSQKNLSQSQILASVLANDALMKRVFNQVVKQLKKRGA